MGVVQGKEEASLTRMEEKGVYGHVISLHEREGWEMSACCMHGRVLGGPSCLFFDLLPTNHLTKPRYPRNACRNLFFTWTTSTFTQYLYPRAPFPRHKVHPTYLFPDGIPNLLPTW